MEEFLKKSKIFYNLSKERYQKLLSELQKELKDNQSVLKRLALSDYEYNKQNISFEKLDNIISDLKNEDIIENREDPKTIVFSYYGDPYITINLCIMAILTHTKIILAIEDMMTGINKAIVKIVNGVLNDYRIQNLIYLENLVPTSDLKKNEINIDKVICIGNKNIYISFKKQNVKNLEFIPYNNIDLYCETEELEELKKAMCLYTYENNIEMEMYDDISVNEAIKEINMFGEHNISVILSRNEDSINKFKKEVKSNKVYANENPFKKETFKIDAKYFI